jgi:hypothetical protein
MVNLLTERTAHLDRLPANMVSTGLELHPTRFGPASVRRSAALLVIVFGSAVLAGPLHAAALRNGRVSHAVHQVRFVDRAGQPQAVTGNSVVNDGALETGLKSRAELTFADNTILRLGDNTNIRLAAADRSFELVRGAVLTQVPAGVGKTELRIGEITATITGTTLVAECMPGTYAKFISLEGTSRVCLRASSLNQDCVLLRAGEMLIVAPKAKMLPDTADVDLTRLAETCELITAFSALPGEQRLTRAAANQRKNKGHGNYADTNLVIRGRGTVVNMKANAGTTPKNKSGTAGGEDQSR